MTIPALLPAAFRPMKNRTTIVASPAAREMDRSQYMLRLTFRAR